MRHEWREGVSHVKICERSSQAEGTKLGQGAEPRSMFFAVLEKQQVSDLENYMSEGSELRMEKGHPMFSYIQGNEISMAPRSAQRVTSEDDG